MKNIIAITSLIVAGAICANAATTFTTTNPTASTTVGAGGYYGFAANFTSSVVGTTTSTGEGLDFSSLAHMYLTNLTLKSGATGSGFGTTFKVAIYKYTNDGNVGDFLALSNETATTAEGTDLNFTFNSVDLGASNATYQFLFVTENTTIENLQSSGLDGYKSKSTTARVEVLKGAGNLPSGSGTYKVNTLNEWEGHYIPKYTLTTSDVQVIPEPSAFGLLAGLGALALVGARRRRR